MGCVKAFRKAMQGWFNIILDPQNESKPNFDAMNVALSEFEGVKGSELLSWALESGDTIG